MKKIILIIAAILLLALSFKASAERLSDSEFREKIQSSYYAPTAPPQTAANQPIIDQAVAKGQLELWRHTAEVRMAFVIVLTILLVIALMFAYCLPISKATY